MKSNPFWAGGPGLTEPRIWVRPIFATVSSSNATSTGASSTGTTRPSAPTKAPNHRHYPRLHLRRDCHPPLLPRLPVPRRIQVQTAGASKNTSLFLDLFLRDSHFGNAVCACIPNPLTILSKAPCILFRDNRMLPKFKTLNVTRSRNVPTLLAYDPKSGSVVIGEDAKRIASRHQLVVQDFKLAIGESDAMFEGRFTASASARPQHLWELRTDGTDSERFISTRDATKAFLERLLSDLDSLPKQLVIGIPASKD
jgi:hypothetical protein